MDFCFILVEPENPENVGAAARALNTMGFSDLRLVNPCDHLSVKARQLAHGSTHLLEEAKLYQSFEDAIKDVSYTVATTSISHNIYKKFFDAKDLPKFLDDRFCVHDKIAIIFGRESIGLKNDEIEMCDIVTGIPMIRTLPSINLAQTVMIYAYRLSCFKLESGLQTPEKTNENSPKKSPKKSSNMPQKVVAEGGYRLVKDRVASVLNRIDILPDNRTHKKVMDFVATMNYQQLQMLHYLCEKAEDTLNQKG